MKSTVQGIVFLAVLAVLAAGCVTTSPRGECRGSARVVSAARAELFADLTSSVPERQARARQLLPYHGVDAVPDLLPLLSNPDPVVGENAYYVILDIANAACTPGRESDRARVTKLLMGLLKGEGEAPAEPQDHQQPRLVRSLALPDVRASDKREIEIQITALHILERIVPPDYDVAPIVSLLKGSDAVLREKARAALARINTEPALRALRAALRGADADFQCAILNGLAQAKDAGSMQMAADMVNHPDACVRLSAARALAWTGDPAHTKAVETVVAQADDATRKDSIDVLLCLAQAMEAKDRVAARGIYDRLLDRPEGTVVQASAAGLGRTGDVESAKRIMRLLESPDIAVRHAAIDAVRKIEDDAVTALMLEAYATARPEDKRVFVLALGCRKSTAVIEPLQAAAATDNAVMRRTAFAALAETGLPEAIDGLLASAAQPREGDNEYIERALSVLAEKTRDASQPELLTKAYRSMFELATDTSMRLVALRGLAEHPSADLYGVAMKAAADDALKGATADLLVGVAAAAYVGGNHDKAHETLDVLCKVDSAIQRLQSYRDKVRALGGKVDITPLLGGIRKWQAVGPFKVPDLAIDWGTDFVHEQDIDLKATYTWGGKTLAWKSAEGDGDFCIVDLAALMGAPSTCYAYAYTEITVGERQLATLRLGSDDGIAAWVNGAKVHDNFVDRGTTPDSDIIQIRLEAGVNKLLLKISQGGGGWNFCARITDRDGRPLNFRQ